MICYKCGQPGHLRIDCPLQQKTGDSQAGSSQTVERPQGPRVPASPAQSGTASLGVKAGTSTPRGGGRQGQGQQRQQGL